MSKGKKRKAPKGKRRAAKNPTRRDASGKTTSLDRERRKVKALETQIANMRKRSRSTAKRRAEETKRRRSNPRRPPHAWWARCLSSVEASRYARDPAAVCGAAWWRMPRAKREAIVRRLERSRKRRDRKIAYAIARAERNRAQRAPRRRNPQERTDAVALADYERTHWGERGRGKVSQLRAANPRHGTSTNLGRLVSVVYLTKKKGDRELTEYEHEFEGPLPTLAYNDGGLIVAGGRYRVKTGGITG